MLQSIAQFIEQRLTTEGSGGVKPTCFAELAGRLLASGVVWREHSRPEAAAHAALAQTVPLQGFYMTTIVSSERTGAMPERERIVQFHWISPGYLAAMGTALLAGRDFADVDASGRSAVAIANTALIDKFFAGDQSLPKRLVRPSDDGGIQELSIIGIAENVQFKMLGEEAMPALYVPVAQQLHPLDRLRSAVLVVRPQPGHHDRGLPCCAAGP